MCLNVLTVQSRRGLLGLCWILALVLPARGAEPKAYLQTNISAAKIVEAPNGFAVEVTILASDFEEMFQNTMSERRGVDLSGPGLLEVEIGRFFAKRIVMRDQDGRSCSSKVERAGEDPANDEGVRVALSFECAGREVFYDASKFLSAHGARAWQVVTITRRDEHRQVMINAESPAPSITSPQ